MTIIIFLWIFFGFHGLMLLFTKWKDYRRLIEEEPINWKQHAVADL